MSDIKVIRIDDSNRDRIRKKPGVMYYDTGDDDMFIHLAGGVEINMPHKYIQFLAKAGAFPDWVSRRIMEVRKQSIKVGYRKPYEVHPFKDTKDIKPGRMYFTDDCLLMIALEQCDIPDVDTEAYPVGPEEMTDLLAEGLMPRWVMEKIASYEPGVKH